MKKIVFITTLSILFFTSCKNKNNGEDNILSKKEHSIDKEHTDEHELIQVTKEQFKNNGMLLGGLSKKNFPEIVKAKGLIDVPPQNKEIITSVYGGIVRELNLLVGDNVNKGQSVVVLESPEFVDIQQNYLELKEKLNYLKSEYERQKLLFDEQITSQKKFLSVESDYKSALALFKGLRNKLKMLNINPSYVESGKIVSRITLYASIPGSVTKISVVPGTFVSPSDEIMEIINSNHKHLELSVFEKDALKVKKGQAIRFVLPATSNKYYKGEVHIVGKSIDNETRTIKVHGHLKNEANTDLKVGMFVEADIEIENKEKYALQETAFVESDNRVLVLKLEKEESEKYIFKPIEVKKGKTYNGFAEVLSDNIKETDIILIKGSYSLVGVEEGEYSY